MVDLEKLKQFKEVFAQSVAYIDEQQTINNLYNQGVDYGVAKRMVGQAIERTKVVEHEEKTIKT
ncbi:MAG: hypothetical protein ACOCWM_05735 [Cyclobacteriaceae bacterium]